MKSDFQEAMNCIAELPYQAYGIQMYLLYKTNKSEGIYLIKQAPIIEAVFIVKATLQNDIYELHTGGSAQPLHLPPTASGIAYGIAMIPSLKSSIMMNSLFRTIKENANLDLLEESDDEEEFENRSESKFVDLDKSYMMKCVFLKRFRKWQPLEVIKDIKSKVITYKEALFLEKRGNPL